MAAILEVAQETAISEGEALRERLHSTAEALETRISTTHTRIHKFPHRLQGIGGADNCHVVPSVVAIGPYHHGLPHLQEMEGFKQAAAYRLLQGLGCTVEEVYDEKIVSVASDARRCYDASVVAGLGDVEFATMMFVDACFLVWYLDSAADDKLFLGLVLSSGRNIDKDIFMLENQIPWLVVQAIVEITNNNRVGLRVSDSKPRAIRPRNEEEKKRLMAQWRRLCFPDPTTDNDDGRRGDDTDSIIRRYTPAHLLGLLRFSLICSMPHEKREIQFNFHNTGLTTTCRTAFELAQVGIKLAASKATWFADMHCVKKPVVLGKLSLSPLYLTDVTTCWLVNMAALESVQASNADDSFLKDGYVISSYLSTLAMLMDQEEDVQELRRSGIVKTNFTNTETLAFFKGLGKHLRRGINCFNTLAEIDKYMRQRPVRIAIHKFVYNNYRSIVALMSIVSVLVGIFKAIYSLKKP